MKKLFLLLCVVITSSSALAQVYALSKVTSVEDQGYYVFECNHRVLGNTITSGALNTKASFNTTGLAGTEAYVWRLEVASGGYYMRNMSYTTSSSAYLKNPSSNSLSFSSKETVWTFTFAGDSAVIRKKGGNGLGDTGIYGDPGNSYKLYVDKNLEKTYHGFTVYRLVDTDVASVSAAEYATFSSPYALDFSGEEGLTVYTASVGQGKVSLHEVTSKRVPANTAVVLHGTSGSYTGAVIAEADALTGNDLHIATEAMSGADNNIYVLNKKNGLVGFYKLSATGTLAQGKAYLTQEGGAPMLSMSDDGEATAVTAVPLSATTGSGVCYTLDGRRVAHPTKGVYIQNGRKMVVR